MNLPFWCFVCDTHVSYSDPAWRDAAELENAGSRAQQPLDGNLLELTCYYVILGDFLILWATVFLSVK